MSRIAHMETVKPITPFRGRAALLATACLIAPLTAGEPRGGSSAAGTGVSRTNVAVEEAQVLLRKGDEAYTAARYSEAVDAYAGAFEIIPKEESASGELRAATAERYAQASVEYARDLSRKGDVAGAKAAVDKVLDDSVAPKNVGALNFRAQLDDPIRTNPALTAEHGKNVDSVRRLLYTAEGAYNLGKYDEAKRKYEDVLRIDRTNTAARRGLEVLASARSEYSKSAYDQARAEMLTQVDSQWELQIPAPELDPSLTAHGDHTLGLRGLSVKAKLDRIIVPKIMLDQASLQEALDFLRLRAVENDTTELDPTRKGVNFTVNLGSPDSPAAQKINALRFDLRLSNVPISQILKYITSITGTSFSTDDYAVNITPAGTASAELVTRTYRVPPDFISSLSLGADTESTATNDPFAETSKQGLLPKRLGAQEALAKQGVTFPEGSSVSYIATSNTLRIVNTPTNQEYISQIIETLTKTEPMSVTVRVTMIRVEESRLEELGFDWLLDNFGFGGPGWVPGSSKLNLSGGTQGNGDSVDDMILPTGVLDRRPLTAGNRSGDSAISGNSIDTLLTDPSGRQSSSRAPGVIGLNGAVSGANFQTLMRGLDQKKGVDMMAQPSVVTRSNQESSIAIVREFIYPTEYEPPELPNDSGGGGDNNNEFFGFIAPASSAVTPATPTAFEKEDVGITLNVLPIVDPSKSYVNVTLNPVFSDFDGFVNYGSPINKTVNGTLGPEALEITSNEILMPVFSKQKLSTNVNVADGATIVVGGLLSESVQNVDDKTPILGDLPIFGRLFQSKAKKPTSVAIIFMVNVEITDPTGRPFRSR